MTNMEQFALQLLQKNPNVSNSPVGRELIDILQKGDQKRGEELARNLCKTNGVSEQEALNQANRFFGMKR